MSAPVAPVPSQAWYDGSDPLTAPLLDLYLPPVPAAAAPVAPVPAVVPAPEAAPAAPPAATWTCRVCATASPFTDLRCPACGTSSIDDPSATSLEVPGLGDLRRFSRGQRLGAAAALVGLFVVPLAVVTFLATPKPVKQQPVPATGTSETLPGSDTSTSTTTP